MKCDIACLFEVNVIGKLHVLGMNLEDLKTPHQVENINVDFLIKAAETAECRINQVQLVGGGHKNNIDFALRPSMSIRSHEMTRRSASPLVYVYKWVVLKTGLEVIGQMHLDMLC